MIKTVDDCDRDERQRETGIAINACMAIEQSRARKRDSARAEGFREAIY